MNKTLKIILICLLVILVVGFSLGLGILINSDFNFNNFSFSGFSFYSDNLVEEKEINDIKNLYIDYNSCDLHINDSTDEIITVQIFSDDASEHEIKVDDDKINIHLKEKNSFHFFSKASRIVINVPLDYDKNIDINGNAGDIHIGNLNKASSVIDFHAGDVRIDEINKLDAKFFAGDLRIGKVNTLLSDMNAGDIRINNLNNYINAKLNAGDIRITNLNIDKNSKISVNAGDIKINNTNDIYIDCDSGVGDTKIGKNNRKSEIELKIKISVGDVKINK